MASSTPPPCLLSQQPEGPVTTQVGPQPSSAHTRAVAPFVREKAQVLPVASEAFQAPVTSLPSPPATGPLAQSAPTAPVSSLFLSRAQYAASGPLHRLFLPSVTLLPHTLALLVLSPGSGLCSNAISSVGLALANLFKIATLPPHSCEHFQIIFTCFIFFLIIAPVTT